MDCKQIVPLPPLLRPFPPPPQTPPSSSSSSRPPDPKLNLNQQSSVIASPMKDEDELYSPFQPTAPILDSQIQRKKVPFWITPPSRQPQTQSHRPFSSFSPQHCRLLRPGTGWISNPNPTQGNWMLGPTEACFQMLSPNCAVSNFEQGMRTFPMRPLAALAATATAAATAQNNGMMQPPSDARRQNFEQGMGPIAMRPPPPPAQGAWPSFPPAQMMNHGIVSNNPRPLDLGMFPPWQLTVTLPSGDNRRIDIPYSEGPHIIGLPLGLDVPQVIASNYKALLCMVNGMTCIITDLTRNLDQHQKDAARYLDDKNCYRLELDKLKCSIRGDMVVPQDVMASVSPSKKRKTSREESGPCETKPVCINKAEQLPPPTSDERPDSTPVLLVQESVTEEDMDVSDDSPLTTVKRSRGEEVHTGASLCSSDVQTKKVEYVAGVEFISKEPVDATITSISTNSPTVDSKTALTIPAPKDIITPPLVKSDEGYECVDNFKVPKEYAVLYKKIFNKYGHMATKKVVKSDAILLTCVTSLLKIASIMETVRGADLSEVLLESWEGDIKDAETLQFNINWLREKLNRLMFSLKLSFRIDKEVESREQVIDATQEKYLGLYSREDELYSELSELKINIRKSEAKILFEREAIGKKMAQKNAFLYQPVLGNMFS